MRKGPEHVPHSVLILTIALALFAVAMFVSEAMVVSAGTGIVLVSVFVSFLGYGLYWIVMAATGFTHRFLPTVSCIMACGSILTIMMVAIFVLLRPVAGNQVAALIAWLVLIWSVPVKGHIIARAINQHWYTGIAIALTIYIAQRLAYDALTATSAA